MDFYVRQGDFSNIVEQVRYIDASLLRNSEISERVLNALLHMPDIELELGDDLELLEMLIDTLDGKDIAHPVLFKIWRSGNRKQYKNNAKSIVRFLSSKQIFDKNAFLLSAFFKIEEYRYETTNYIISNIHEIELNDIGLIYDTYLHWFDQDEILDNLYALYRKSRDYNLLEKLTVLAYIQKIPLSKWMTKKDISQTIKKLKKEKKYSNLVKHLDSYLKSDSFKNKSKHKITLRKTKVDKPKVAVCISGQLRGYQKTWSSIKESIVDPFNADVFVHVWEDIGFKDPLLTRGHAGRTFSGETLNAWLEIGKTMEFKKMKERYGAIWDLLPKGKVTQAEISDFYNAKACVVEDDKAENFKNFNNVQKMYYKIDAAYQMAKNFHHYDYYIRVRPDKKFSGSLDIDSQEFIYNNANLLIVDEPIKLLPKLLFVGDQFSMSTESAMNIYASIHKNVIKYRELGYYSADVMKAHEPIAWQLYRNNIRIMSLREMNIFKGAGLYDAQELLDARDIYDKIGKMLEDSQYNPDKLLLSALKKDMMQMEV